MDMGSCAFVLESTVPLDSGPSAESRGHTAPTRGLTMKDHSSFSRSLPFVFLLAAITASSCASSQADPSQAAPAAKQGAAPAPAAKPAPAASSSQAGKPNIVFIMGDDIGMWNIGAYHRGMMAGRTPNLDKLAKEGMLFTDYYAEASCTAGRANFITGMLPIRTGMTTVGQACASVGLPAEAVTC